METRRRFYLPWSQTCCYHRKISPWRIWWINWRQIISLQTMFHLGSWRWNHGH